MENEVLQQILDELKDMRQGITRLDMNQAIMEKSINEIKNNTDHVSKTATRQSLANLEAGQARVESRLDAMQENIDTMQGNFDTMQKNIESMQENIDTMQENIESMQEDIELIKEDTAEIRAGSNAFGRWVEVASDYLKIEYPVPEVE